MSAVDPFPVRSGGKKRSLYTKKHQHLHRRGWSVSITRICLLFLKQKPHERSGFTRPSRKPAPDTQQQAENAKGRSDVASRLQTLRLGRLERLTDEAVE